MFSFSLLLDHKPLTFMHVNYVLGHQTTASVPGNTFLLKTEYLSQYLVIYDIYQDTGLYQRCG